LTAPLSIAGHPEVPKAGFLASALQLVGLDASADWTFTIDQYRNQEQDKNVAAKTLVRSFHVTKATFDHQYDQFIMARVSNILHDWVMVVRINTQPAQAPATFTLPQTDSNGNPPQAIETNNTPQGLKRRVYRHDQNLSEEFINDSADFDSAWKRLLGVTVAQVPATMKINFYSNRLGGDFRFHHHTRYTSIGGNRVYESNIAPLLFDTTQDWQITIQAYPTPDVPAQPLWPPWHQVALTPTATPAARRPPRRNNGRIYAKNGAAFRVNHIPATSKKFLDAAKKALTITNNMYSFRIECHSKQLNRFDSTNQPQAGYQYSHHLLVDQTTLDQVYNQKLIHYLFETGDDWYLRIVPTNDNTRLPAPAPLLALGQSIEATLNVTPVASAQASPDLELEGDIYGYAGRINVGSNETQVLNAMLQLLNLDPADPWWFYATIYKVDGTRDNILTVRKADVATHLRSIMASRVTTGTGEEGKGNFRVFVHRSATAPATFAEVKPNIAYRSIVELWEDKIVSYWKVPNNVAVQHGVNQYQPGFFKAMEVHWNTHQQRPRPHTKIDGMDTDLGFGGMELGQEGLDTLRGKLATQAWLNTRISILNWPAGIPSQTSIGLRMIGNHFQCFANQGSYADMGQQMKTMCNEHIYDGFSTGLPLQFRLWRSARDRESNGVSKLIDINQRDREGQIKEFLERDNTPINCLLFRPEWLKFTIVDSDPQLTTATRVEWDISTGPSLQSFRQTLANLFKLSAPSITDANAQATARAFDITNAQWNQDAGYNSRFVITKDTKEDEWRKDVFDWLPGRELFIVKSTGLDFGLFISSSIVDH
jgi:hypothetical protein